LLTRRKRQAFHSRVIFESGEIRNNQHSGKFSFVSDDDSFRDPGIMLKRTLDGLRRDKFSAGSFQQIFFAVGYVQKAIFVDAANVASLKPVLDECLAGFQWLIPVGAEDRGTAYQDFTIISDSHLDVS